MDGQMQAPSAPALAPLSDGKQDFLKDEYRGGFAQEGEHPFEQSLEELKQDEGMMHQMQRSNSVVKGNTSSFNLGQKDDNLIAPFSPTWIINETTRRQAPDKNDFDLPELIAAPEKQPGYEAKNSYASGRPLDKCSNLLSPSLVGRCADLGMLQKMSFEHD